MRKLFAFLIALMLMTVASTYAIADDWTCPSCGRINNDDMNFCGNCRTEKPKQSYSVSSDMINAWICSTCSYICPEADHFCTKCGADHSASDSLNKDISDRDNQIETLINDVSDRDKVPTLSEAYSPRENVHFTGNAASGQRWYAHYGPGDGYLQVKGGFSPDGTNARGNYHETPLNVYFCENGWYLANVLYNGHGRIVYLPYESIPSKDISTVSKLNSYEGKTTKDATTSWLPEETNNTENDDFKVAKGTSVKVFFMEDNYYFAEFECSEGLVRMWLPKDCVSFQ